MTFIRIFMLLIVIHVGFLKYQIGFAEQNAIIQDQSINLSGKLESPVVSTGSSIVSFTSKFKFWLSLMTLLLGFLVLSLEYSLLSRRNFTANEILRILALTLILIGSLFVVTAGFDSIQISPIMGLFGTIAGYLLGRGVSSSTDNEVSSSTDNNDLSAKNIPENTTETSGKPISGKKEI